MITYEYECESCNETFEARQRISDPPLTRCERCGGPVHRVLSSAPFILKGAGFYVNDYPSESRKKALSEEKKSGAEEKKSGSDGSGGSDSTTTSTTSSTSPTSKS